MNCLFCEIVSGKVSAHIVFEDAACVAFLDHRPLFPGHVLLVPRQHVQTLTELPPNLIQPVFTNVQRLSVAVEQAMSAQGTFIAINNKVSQSVPHLHVHIVPRSKGDGLRGFFWPRRKYAAGEMEVVAQNIRNALRGVL